MGCMEVQMNEYEALCAGVELLGGPTETARKLTEKMGVVIKQPHVSGWMRRGKRLPEKYALHMEYLTECEGRKISAQEFCNLAFAC
jgi:hypothetical protein